MLTLPTTYRSNPVIPFVPNADADRAHSWDWAGTVSKVVSGLTIAHVDPTTGSETFPLQYVGLSRSDAHTIEAFVETHAGRRTGFWCPTFQHEFATVQRTAASGGPIFVREWGYAAAIYPLGLAHRHLYATRNGLVFIGPLQGVSSAGFSDADGIAVYEYDFFGSGTSGDPTTLVVGGHPAYDAIGLRVSRCHWVRFADDAITTEWTHPHLAAITLRVTTIPNEAP
jgi:hypothetical protein